MYQVNGGATTSYSIRGELVDHVKGSMKNIYWGYRENQTHVKWLDDYTVTINDRKLDVRKDTYDWRRKKDINSLHG
jgi:major membrane immunogen (membrane-anchored lipoprotein)